MPVDASREVDLLLDQIFQRQPAVEVNTYVVSAIAQLRRTLDRNHDSLLPPPASSLPAWVLPEPKLGPYETRMLETILSSPGPIIVFRGGTGSGKSSALGYLQQHVVRSAQQQVAAKRIPLNYTKLLLSIDLNPVLPSDNSDKPSVADDISIDDLLNYISNGIVAALDTFSPFVLGDIVRQTCASGQSITIGLREVVLSALKMKAEPHPDTWGALAPARCVQAFHAAAEKLNSSQRLVAWLCVLRTVEQRLNPGAVAEWPLVIVLDNVDPLSVKVQQKLLDELVRITSDAAWGRLKIVIGMRLSTFAQFCGSYGFNTYDHEGPDPIEILFLRLTVALLAFDSIPQVSRLSPQLKVATYSRLISLFASVTDRYGYFVDILAALAGTNIRNSFQFARNWCLNHQLPEGMDAGRHQHFRSQLNGELARHVLGNVARGIAREFIKCSRRLSRAWTNQELRECVGVDGIVAELLPAMEHAALATHFMDAPHADDILAILNSEIAYWRKRLDSPSGDAAVSPSSYGMLTLCQAMRNCMDEGIARGLDRDFIDGALSKLAVRTAQAAETTADEQGKLLVWISLACDVTRTQEARAAEWRRLRRYGTSHASMLATISSGSTPSRYEAECSLLSPPQGTALNVLAVSGEEVCAIGLRALYLLYQRSERGVSRSDLQNFLLLHGYSPTDIERVLTSMIDISRRLIFSGVHDSYLGMDGWHREPDAAVILGTAGVSYVTKLVVIPSYLQWATWEIGAVRAVAGNNLKPTDRPRKVRDRLTAARIGLQKVWEDEFRRIEDGWKRVPQGRPRAQFLRCSELECQSAAADVFFRSLDAFIQVHLLNYQGIRARDRAAAEDYVLDAQAWIDLGETIKRHHDELFEGAPAYWQVALDEARQQARGLA